MRTFTSANDIVNAVGEELGTSEWVTVTQDQVNTFAEATGDHQWIHVDAERAERESPFGGPIAHGYLSLSLLPMLGWQIYTIEGAKMGRYSRSTGTRNRQWLQRPSAGSRSERLVVSAPTMPRRVNGPQRC